MARKKSRKKAKKKVVCDHSWGDWSWTHTSWHDIGQAYIIHRSCRKCSFIDWHHIIKEEQNTAGGRERVNRWIEEEKCLGLF